MTENKQYILIPFEEGNLIFKDDGREFFNSVDCLKDNEIVDLLNDFYGENEQLKQEKEELQSKARILLDFYSKRYGDAVFNGERHSKTLREELWIVKEVLSELGLYGDD